MGANPWHSLSSYWQDELRVRLNGSKQYEWRARSDQFKDWYTNWYGAGAKPPPKMPVSAGHVFPEFIFNTILTSDERNSLLCVLAKMKQENLFKFVEQIGWIGDSANMLFWPTGGAGLFVRHLLQNGFGDWWAASYGKKWDWGVRSRFRGCQLHFRGNNGHSTAVEGHLDMNNPGDSTEPGAKPSGALAELGQAISHKWNDDWFRAGSHSPDQVRGALRAQGISVPAVP
jgi:hypothetical protein